MIPPWERIVETKKCRLSGRDFFVTDKDLEFYDKVSPIFWGVKYPIPSPALCPDERMRLLQSFVNQRHLYRRKSWLSQIELVSNFSESAKCPVYSVSEWYSDLWDPKTIVSDISFDKKMFEQCGRFFSSIPHWSLSQGNNNENCDFSNHGQANKSCYLLVTGSYNTQVHYWVFVYNSTNCIDCDYSKENEYCFESVDLQSCYKLFWSSNCSNCRDSILLAGCQNCQNCFWCWNLKWKKFHILNKEVPEEKYHQEVARFLWLSFSEQRKVTQHIRQISQASYYMNIHGYSNEDVSWDYIYNSSHVWNSFEIKGSENIKDSVSLDASKSTYDCLMSRNSEWNYYCSLVSARSSFVVFSNAIMGSSRVFCSDSCVNVTDCFACCWLHSHEHHCIFNKPYSVAEYEQLCWKIIDHMISTGEWWEFFPHELSPFGYNETVAQEYFPLTESEVKSRGWNWYNGPEKTYEASNALIPLPISDYDERAVWFEKAQKNIDTLLAGVLKCEVTGRLFKIIRQELVFYIENHLPIPTKHPDQRHKERMALRNPRELHERHCAECGVDIITTYAPERTESVVCEECYRKIVY